MKAIRITSIGEAGKPGNFGLEDMPIPEPKDNQVRVKVAYASICGSDPHVLTGNLGPWLDHVKKNLPRGMGHEMSGYVDKIGPKAEAMGLKVGDRVTGNYRSFCGSCHYCRIGKENYCTHYTQNHDAMAEYCCWNADQIYKIPDSVSLLDASLAEPLSIALNAVKTVNVKFGSRVAIFGAGGIGLMLVQLARLAGAAQVVVFDLVEEKLKVACGTGADLGIDPTKPDALKEAEDFTGGLGFDAVIECSGASSAARMAIQALCPDGHAVFFAMYKPDFQLEVNAFVDLYMLGKHIHGMFTSADLFEDTVATLGRMNFKPIINKIYPLEKCKEAFDDQFSGKYAKIIFEVAGEKRRGTFC
jgi:(R,R)-butanediol dehydrogenase/meso-butanediol dehydrogenase/diacetyl reductase/L-iditol 2-dehydrogenase